MATVSNNDIARAIYLASKNKAQFSDLMHRVISFLHRRRLLSRAPDIFKRLDKIINKEDGTILAKVIMAEKLSGNARKEILHFLKKRHKAIKVILEENINPKLLGGARIEVDDEILDLSIKNKISKLQEYLTRPA